MVASGSFEGGVTPITPGKWPLQGVIFGLSVHQRPFLAASGNAVSRSYDYNIRSNITSIAGSQLTETLYYNSAPSGGTPRWGGGIAGVIFAAPDIMGQSWTYDYDFGARRYLPFRVHDVHRVSSTISIRTYGEVFLCQRIHCGPMRSHGSKPSCTEVVQAPYLFLATELVWVKAMVSGIVKTDRLL